MRFTFLRAGLDETLRKLETIREDVVEFVEKELEIQALDLAGKAATRAPVMTGDLRGSWFAVASKGNILNEEADSNPKSERQSLPTVGKYEIAVGFSEPYAERQHESMTFRHELGGEAKFLENPLKENAKKYVNAIAEVIQKAVEK